MSFLSSPLGMYALAAVALIIIFVPAMLSGDGKGGNGK